MTNVKLNVKDYFNADPQEILNEMRKSNFIKALKDNKILEERDYFTSIELVDYFINPHREDIDGISSYHHHHLMGKIRMEANNMYGIGLKESKYDSGKRSQNNCFELNKDCIKYLIDVIPGSDKIPLQKAYEKLGGTYTEIFVRNRFETEFMIKLIQTLDVMDIELIREYKVLNHFIDGYLPQYNLAIEYDDGYHFYEPQITLDKKREDKIINEIGCKFVRLDYQNTDATNIGIVIKKILELK